MSYPYSAVEYPTSASPILAGFGRSLTNLMQNKSWSRLLLDQIQALDALGSRIGHSESNFEHEKACLPVLVQTILGITAGWLESSKQSNLAGCVGMLRGCAASPEDLSEVFIAANLASGVVRQGSAAHAMSLAAVRALTSVAGAMKLYAEAASVPVDFAQRTALSARAQYMGMHAASTAANCPSSAWAVGDLSYQAHVPGDADMLLATLGTMLALWEIVPESGEILQS